MGHRFYLKHFPFEFLDSWSSGLEFSVENRTNERIGNRLSLTLRHNARIDIDLEEIFGAQLRGGCDQESQKKNKAHGLRWYEEKELEIECLFSAPKLRPVLLPVRTIRHGLIF
jgi:hypothetical protein